MDGIIQNSAWDSECTRFLPSVFLWEKAPVHDMIPRYHQKECEHGKVLLNGIVYEDKDATDANKSRLLLEARIATVFRRFLGQVKLYLLMWQEEAARYDMQVCSRL